MRGKNSKNTVLTAMIMSAIFMVYVYVKASREPQFDAAAIIDTFNNPEAVLYPNAVKHRSPPTSPITKTEQADASAPAPN